MTGPLILNECKFLANAVYTFNENSQLNVIKAPKLTSHKKAPNIKKWFKEYMPPTISPALQIAALFYERILSAYMPANKLVSLLDYTPLHAAPLSACIQLKWSYHMHIISSSLGDHETKLINSTVLTILFSTNKDTVLKWISKCKTTTGIGVSSSHALSSSHTSSSSNSTTKKSSRKKMASCKSNPGKHHKSVTISQELEMAEQPKSKGKEKPTRNKSVNGSKHTTSLETTTASSSSSSKCKRDSPTHPSPSKIAKTKKTKESKKAPASNHDNSSEEEEEASQSSSSSSSSGSGSNDSNSSDESYD